MEQSIYTYCYKRFDEVGGGWGFFSYSDGMKKYFSDIPSLREAASGHGYEIPCNTDVWLVQELTDLQKDIESERMAIEKYHPEKFAYRRINENGHDIAVFSYGRNLGREIIAEETRTSNKVVYTTACEYGDLTGYPCALHENSFFGKLDRKYFKSSSKESPADALGRAACDTDLKLREKVMEFLAEDPEREEILVKLFYTVIKERSGAGRPVILCDRNENIFYWISALTMLFPAETAGNIFFTTYDFLGDTIGNTVIPSEYHICGVYSPALNDAEDSDERATNYNVDEIFAMDSVVVFDFECWVFPEVETDDFVSVIHEFCTGNTQPLDEYHRRMMTETTYRDFGELYSRFFTYTGYDSEVFDYLVPEMKKEIFSDMIPDLLDVSTDDEKFSAALECTMKSYEADVVDREQFKNDIVLFVKNTMKDQKADLGCIERIAPVLSLFKTHYQAVVKKVFSVNYRNYIKDWDLGDSHAIEKLKSLICMYSPYKRSDGEFISEVFKELSATSDGIYVKEKIIREWTEEFNMPVPERTPEDIAAFSEVITDRQLFEENLSDLFYDVWNRTYRERVLTELKDTEIYSEFNNNIVNASYRRDVTAEDMYFIISIHMKTQSSYEDEWHKSAVRHLEGGSATYRKKYFDLLFADPHFKPELLRLYESEICAVYQKFNFNADELVRFAAAHFRHILNPGEYPVNWVSDSARRMEIEKKEWKKAARIALQETERSADDLRSALMDGVYDYIEDEDAANPENKGKGLFNKLFR